MKDKNVFSELLLTIAAVTVRQELCAQVGEAGGLKFIYDGMVQYILLRSTQTKIAIHILRFTERAFDFDTSIKGLI